MLRTVERNARAHRLPHKNIRRSRIPLLSFEVCREEHEGLIRTILLRHVNSHGGMTVQGIATQDDEKPDKTTVVAEVFSVRRNDREMENLMSRLNIEPSVTAVRWEKV